jgi:hypothetical protein
LSIAFAMAARTSSKEACFGKNSNKIAFSLSALSHNFFACSDWIDEHSVKVFSTSVYTVSNRGHKNVFFRLTKLCLINTRTALSSSSLGALTSFNLYVILDLRFRNVETRSVSLARIARITSCSIRLEIEENNQRPARIP